MKAKSFPACRYIPVLALLLFAAGVCGVFAQDPHPRNALIERAEEILGSEIVRADAAAVGSLDSLIGEMERSIGDETEAGDSSNLPEMRILLTLLKTRRTAAGGSSVLYAGADMSASRQRWSVPGLFGIAVGTGLVSLSVFPVFWNLAMDENERYTRSRDPGAARLAELYSWIGYGALGLGTAALVASIPALASSYAPGVHGSLTEDEAGGSYRERSSLERRIAYAEKAADGYRAGIVVSLGAGILSFAGFGLSLWLGQSAYDAYEAARYSSDAAAARDNLERWRTAVVATGILGSAGLGCAALFAVLNPDLEGLERRMRELDEKILMETGTPTGAGR